MKVMDQPTGSASTYQ